MDFQESNNSLPMNHNSGVVDCCCETLLLRDSDEGSHSVPRLRGMSCLGCRSEANGEAL